jgi:hypothetical protein
LGVALYDAIKNELNIANGLTIVYASAWIGFGIAALIPAVANGMGAVMGAIIGAAIAGAVWIIQNTDDTVSKITGIISAASLAVGAILAFTGINVPLGIALMAAGAVTMGTVIALNTNALSDDVKGVIAAIASAVASAALAVGAVLAFTGVNIPLGIALMAGGALVMGTAIMPKWNSLSDPVKKVINLVTREVGAALLALGAMLAFTGVNIPLGVALMAGGALSAATAVTLNWNSITTALKGPVGDTIAMISGAFLALGAILVMSGAAMPLGISLLAAGAIGLVTAIIPNWTQISGIINKVLSSILAVISGAMLAIGVLMCLSGAGIGVGLALIFGAIAGGVVAWKVDNNPITNFIKEVINVIFRLVNGVTDLINDLFHFKFEGLVIAGVEVIPSFDFRLFTIPKIPLLAEGGFPEQGQLFIAREAGAEMVGNIGRKTAVANNDQIVSGIASGVSEANEEQNALMREEIDLLRAILAKDNGTYLDGRLLTNSVERYQRERGRVVMTGGGI